MPKLLENDSLANLKAMLRRAPTRLEMKSDDMKEYDEVLAERTLKAGKNSSLAQGNQQQVNERHERIGYKPPPKK